MATVYITEQGATVKKVSETLLVEKEREKIADIELCNVDSVLIFGNIQVTTQAMSVLLDNGIETAFLTMNGKLKGHLMPIMQKNVILRMSQYERYKDADFRIYFAKTIVKSKILNSMEALKRFHYNHSEIEELQQFISALEEFAKKVSYAELIESLMGYEGIAARTYFSGFSKMCIGEMKFTERKMHPSPDPVNSLLSLGYALVTNEIQSLLEAMGFDPYIGFYHSIEYGRTSLALDLLEEYRSPLIDRFVLYLINNRIFNENDFESDGEGGVRLQREHLKRYFAEYERYLTRIVENGQSEHTPMRNIFKKQVEKMAKTVIDKVDYMPYKFEA